MYNLILAVAISIAAFLLAPLFGFPWISGLLPAMFALPAAAFLLMRRTARQVEAEAAPVQAIAARMQSATTPAERDAAIAEIREVLVRVKEKHGKWQLWLEESIDGQLGMLLYGQGKYDEAAPLLARSTRDGNAQLGLACIHVRKGDLDAASAAFKAAASAAPKEPNIFLMWGAIMASKGRREEALAALTQGLDGAPEHKQLKHVKHQVANKTTIDPETTIGEGWFMYFPEDLLKHLAVHGRRGSLPDHLPAAIRAQYEAARAGQQGGHAQIPGRGRGR
jgi:tetratricopeptide (TPR) repeat protein